MLGVKNYTQAYIDDCRERIDADVAAYRDVVTAATKGGAGDKVLATFEARYFNDMVVLLDALFVHRLRTVEGKDGNPMNEVRVLTNSLLNEHGVMTPEKSIKLVPEKSVLGLAFGDEIKLTEDAFMRLSRAYFTEIAAKFADGA